MARVISFAAPVSIRAAEATEGQPRTFELTAYTGEPMRISGFRDPVVIDCSTLDLTQQSIPALYDHADYEDCIVGQINQITVGQNGLPPIVAKGIFTPVGGERDASARVLARADAGYRWQASVGGEPSTVIEVKPGEKVTVNGREYVGPISIAKGLILREISFVVLGGDRQTSAVVARRSKVRANMKFEEWLVTLGFADPSSLDEIQKSNLQLIYNNEQGAGAPPEPEAQASDAASETEEEEPVAAEMAEEEEETPPANARAKKNRVQAKRLTPQEEKSRIKKIRNICARYGNPSVSVGGIKTSLADAAIRAGWGIETVEIEAMRNQRRSGPNPKVKAQSGGQATQILEGALLIRAGGQIDHPKFQSHMTSGLLPTWLRASLNDSTKNRIMDEAFRVSQMSAVDIAAESLRASGRQVPRDRFEMIRAAFSSGSLTNVITTSMNAILIATYLDYPDSTIGWVKENDVANYLLQERPRVTKGQSLSPMPENATADHHSMSDVAETYKVQRYGGQFVVDEIAIINDSLGAIQDKPREMGAGAARLRSDLVWAEIMSNPTLTATGRSLFNSTDANLLTSTSLTHPNLKTALARMALIRENSVNLNIMPTHIAVPPSLRDTAREFIGSDTIVVAGSTDVTKGVINPIFDYNLALITDPRLENGVVHPETGTTHAGSSTTWYLFSAFSPGIEVGFLRGTGRMPRTVTEPLTGGQFGTRWIVTHTVGICPLDWKGLQKHTA